MNRIRKGDTVKIMTGAHRGKVVEVERVDGDKVYLKGLKVVERHYRASQFNQGGKQDVHLPIHISNLSLVVDKDKPTKVSYLVKDNKKVRIAKVSGKEIK